MRPKHYLLLGLAAGLGAALFWRMYPDMTRYAKMSMM